MTTTDAPPDFLDAATLRDPYPSFHWLRANDPVYWCEPLNAWLLTRYDDVYSLQRDAKRFSSRRAGQLIGARVPEAERPALEPFIRLASQWMNMVDPPRHTEMRALLKKGFTPRAAKSLRPRIQKVVDELIASHEQQATMDLIADFAFPLTAILLATIYGLPAEDSELLKEWSADIALLLTGSLDPTRGPQEAVTGITEMNSYFQAAMTSRRDAPPNDLIGRVVTCMGKSNLSEEEIRAQITSVLVAGYTTTTDMLGNGMFTLLSHPEQLDRLRRDPSLLTSAVEEMLRYEPASQVSHRLAIRDVPLGGKVIRNGDTVFLIRAAANRDPERFPDPDAFDIARRDNDHLAFGVGIHYCMGTGLARLEAKLAIATLLSRLPGLRLHEDQPAEWRADNLQFRGLRSLPVRY